MQPSDTVAAPVAIRAHAAPALSICIPAYRSVAHLARALAALERQSFTDFRVLVSNDGGFEADKVEALCRAPGIRVMHQTPRLGWVRNCNALLARVRSPYVAILPHDDVPDPDYYARMIAMLEGQAGASTAVSAHRFEGLPERKDKPAIARSVAGPVSARLRAVLEHEFPAITFRGVHRMPDDRRRFFLQPNPAGDLFVDSTWIMQQAALGEIAATTDILFTKHFHATNTHVAWWTEPDHTIARAWLIHCIHIAALALGHSAPSDQAAALAAAERRCFQHAPGPFPPVIRQACINAWAKRNPDRQSENFRAAALQRLSGLRARGICPTDHWETPPAPAALEVR